MKLFASIAPASASAGCEPLTDDLPMDRQLRGLLKLANNSGNTYAPLVLCSLRKTEKELPKKGASLEKIQKPPPKNVCPEIGNIALTT